MVVSELICFLEKKKRENKTTEPKELKEVLLWVIFRGKRHNDLCSVRLASATPILILAQKGMKKIHRPAHLLV